MPDVGAFLNKLLNAVEFLFAGIGNFIESTHLTEQVRNVDYNALFSNPWFMVPFVSMIIYMVYKGAFRDLILVALFMACWWVSGTDYMQTLVVGNQLQINKVLPVLFGGATVLGFVIYLLFGRS